eukprot:scaffold29888_cov15-Tisochrysis_lutea.AAC.1
MQEHEKSQQQAGACAQVVVAIDTAQQQRLHFLSFAQGFGARKSKSRSCGFLHPNNANVIRTSRQRQTVEVLQPTKAQQAVGSKQTLAAQVVHVLAPASMCEVLQLVQQARATKAGPAGEGNKRCTIHFIPTRNERFPHLRAREVLQLVQQARALHELSISLTPAISRPTGGLTPVQLLSALSLQPL